MKWLKRIGIALGILVLVAAAALWWLLDTGAGLRFALAQAQRFSHGALTVQQAGGRLLGPLDLAGVRYRDGQGTDVRIARLHLDLRFWPLLRRRVHVLALAADGVDVAMPKSQPGPEPQSAGFSLKPPVALVLDRVHVGKVTLRQDGRPLFASDSLDLAGSWTDAGIALQRLALRAPDGHADLAGTLAVGRSYRGDGTAAFAWKVAGTAYAGKLAAHSDGAEAHLDLSLAQPTAVQLRLDLAQRGDYAWNGALDAPAFDPKPLLGDSALTSLGLHLQGSGNRLGGRLDGKVQLNGYTLSLQPLAARFSGDYRTLSLDRLVLGSPQIEGTLAAHGTVQLGARPVQADLAVDWKDLKLPAALVGQDLSSHGRIQAKGSTEQFHAEGDLALGPPGKLARLAVNVDGTPRQIALNTLALEQPQGGLHAKGTLTLQPGLAWQLDVQADRLDPGQLLAGWNGALDFKLATAGNLTSQGPDATLDLAALSGTLRQRRLAGSGRLHVSPSRVVDGKLALQSGGSTVALQARPGARNDIDLTLAVASLGDWLPDAGGRLDGRFEVRGLPPRLSVDGKLQGSGLAYQGQKVGSLRLDADLPDISNPGGKLDLAADQVEAGGLAFQHIALRGDGTAANHRLTVDARGRPLSASLALSGSLRGQAWHGTLSTLDLDVQGLPRWRLQGPSQLAYEGGSMSFSELCLSAGEPQLCATAKQDQAGNLDAGYRLHALPLALLMTAAGSSDLPMRAEGSLEGSGALRRNAAGALSGNASIRSAQGSLSYAEHPEQPLLAYRDFALEASLSSAGQRATVRASLDGGGRLDGQVSVSGAQQALAGEVSLTLASVAFAGLFTDELADLKGSLAADFRLGGTVSQPAVDGQATLDGFAAEVPAAGLKLGQGHVVVATRDARRFRIDGSVHSGRGQLVLSGSAGLGEGVQAALSIKGSQFTAADIPAARVVVSPDLTVEQDAKGLDIGGSVSLDSADVDLSKLPGGGATQASPDVVVVDERQQPQATAQLPVTAAVRVDLGNKTHLVGMGLDGRLRGQLLVSEQPGRASTGQGQITVDGSYKAYGQNLHIEQGQLLFASTPLDNPGLNIKAVRKLNPNATVDEGQEVGLLVSGTAQRPVLTVYSNPVMEQSDALSYLVTGKPLSQVKGGEGNMVGAAAQALGSAAGDLLAKSVGSKIGVDEIGVANSDALNGGSAFTVGKYLSPRLFLSYGVGLFDPGQVVTLRYRLSHRWNFEAESATEFSRASLNYRIEK